MVFLERIGNIYFFGEGVDLVDCWVVVFCVNCVYILIILFGSFFFGVFFIILKYLNIKV